MGEWSKSDVLICIEIGDESMEAKSRKAKKTKKQKYTKNIMILCFFLLAISGSVLFGLNEMRKEMIKECKNNLLWEVQLSASEVSDSITNKLAILETIQEMVSRSYTFGPEVASALTLSKNRYNMSYLGLIDTEYVYYDDEGDVVPNTKTNNVDLALAGNTVVARSFDEVSGEGVAFFMPYWENDEIVGVICAKYARANLLEELSVKPQEGTELVVDASGSVVLMKDDFGNYLDGMSWEEFSENGKKWKHKQLFDAEMRLKDCAVASATNKYGKDIYFAVAQVESYKDFYVVRLTSSEVVEKEIEGSMARIYGLMVFMAVFMLCVIGFAIVTYIKNRREVYNVAYVDQLTGISSKTKHKLDAQELIDRREKRYAYVTFDIDNFKYINEMFGYEHGNKVLIHIARVLEKFAKEGELFARVSADNFALLLEDMGTKLELTGRIKELFTMIIEYREPEEELNIGSLSFSCGVYRIDGETDINAVRANANLARTESKKNAIEEIIFYDESLKMRRVEEKELEYEAEEALVNKEFLVYFQPKYDVGSEKIIGAEALVRWNHPVRGMLSPGAFVPVFEGNGFITEVDLYVLNQVCELMETWMKAGIPLICISVNLSRVHLYERNLVERLSEVVKRHNIPPEYIEFELTESAFYEETEGLLRVMTEIKKAGFRLSMDDFGSGYSSLNLLRRLPVDVLKLDKVFFEECDEMGDEIRGKRIVTHVISMAKDLKMEVLAEGVETKDQKEFLQTVKCDMIQGYYYARPMPLKEFELLYKGENGLHCSVHKSVMENEKKDSAQDGNKSET